jgi:hypothetical protein
MSTNFGYRSLLTENEFHNSISQHRSCETNLLNSGPNNQVLTTSLFQKSREIVAKISFRKFHTFAPFLIVNSRSQVEGILVKEKGFLRIAQLFLQQHNQ